VLKYKLFKWFAGVVLIFGALSAFLGITVIGDRIVDEAQSRVSHDLDSARAVYDSQLRGMENIVRLMAVRGPFVEACSGDKWQAKETRQEIEGLLAEARSTFKLDFMAMVTPTGLVVARAAADHTGDWRKSEPIINTVLDNKADVASGTVLMSPEELNREADGLARQALLDLRDTPHARPSRETTEERGMVMLAAAPIKKGGVIGAIYAGILLNRKQDFVDRVQNIVFGQDKYEGRIPLGTATLFLADTRIATTVLLKNGNRAIGTRVSSEVADRVLDNGARWADRALVVDEWYLTAYEPIRDSHNAVIGMLYVGTLERPYNDLRKSMVWRFGWLVAAALVVALLIAMFIAGRLARPLHRLAEGAYKMQHGHGFEPVPADGSCNETQGLIGAFNQMGATLDRRESELKDANTQLAGTNDSLKALNAHYMETLQFVSHELNSPLSAITNYTYMLRQKLLGGLSDKQENALEVINANLRRVMEMVRHYLNLARIESGEMQPVPARVAVREDVVGPILASLQADLNARTMRVEDLIGPRVILHADPNMTREVFENLLSNAVKYGRPGGLITLKCRADGRWAEFAVRNEGDGIPPERRGELFQKFSRIELGESKKTRRGTGLGLFICKKIVEAHGGQIAVDSEVGQWTEFRCKLPLADDAAHAPEARAAPEPRPA
jgi:two-component system NtrC family sensor kinase